MENLRVTKNQTSITAVAESPGQRLDGFAAQILVAALHCSTVARICLTCHLLASLFYSDEL
jgi:hypothetical protein